MLQDKALAILKSGKNVFLTGPAGSGKTHTLNSFIAYLREYGVPVAVTASTGIAATHMKGTTIHSWTGIGIKEQLSHNDLKFLRRRKYLVDRIEKTHVLIIDEISMLHRKQLDLINQVLKYLRNNPAPFGGMQVVFSGDFFQLPPVSKSEETNRDKFAFMAKAWVEAQLVVCYLSEQFRQSNNSLNTLLNEMRQGEVSSFSSEALMECQNNTLDNKESTKLFTHNADVDSINEAKLAGLSTAEELFIAKKKGKPKIIETMVRSLIVPDSLKLKTGARVMFLKNDFEKGVMNGTMGEVVGFDDEDNNPLIKLSNDRTIIAEPAIWSVEDESGKVLASFTQIPLRLAWAITVHKSQGMTLEAAEVDLSKTFERGQGYVALSRLRDFDGLKLLGVNRMAFEVDPLASRADIRFLELSVQADRSLNEQELKGQFERHILKSGGSLDKSKAVKAPKVSTYKKTLELLNKKKDISEIADIRELTESTIIKHISHLVKKNNTELPGHIRPPQKIIKEISNSYRKILLTAQTDDFTEDGELKLSRLHSEIDGKYDYNELKLAMLFINTETMSV